MIVGINFSTIFEIFVAGLFIGWVLGIITTVWAMKKTKQISEKIHKNK